MNTRNLFQGLIRWLVVLSLGMTMILVMAPPPSATAATTICGWVENPFGGPGNMGVLALTLTVCDTNRAFPFEFFYGTFEPSAQAQVDTLLAQGAIPGYVRITDPVLRTFADNTTMLVGFSLIEPIAGCEACNPPPPTIPAPTTVKPPPPTVPPPTAVNVPAPTNPPPTAVNVPAPTNPPPTAVNVPAPTNPPPTAVPTLCGLSTSAAIQSSMTGTTRPVLIPCGSNQPIAFGALGQWGDERLYRFYNPQIAPTDKQDSSLGAIELELVGWDRMEEIPSCQACEQADPHPQYQNSLMLKSLAWVSPPVAFEPATLILTLEGEGTDIQKASFLVEISFGEDFPYHEIQYTFDSQDPQSAAYLSPSTLQAGKFEMRITGLRFPMTYQGVFSVAVSLKSDPDAVTSLSRQLSIGNSPHAYLHCAGAALTAAALLVKGPSATGVAFTTKYLTAQERIQLCRDDDLACQTHEMASFQQDCFNLAIEQGAKLTQVGAAAVTFKTLITLGFDTAKCGQWLIDYHKQILHLANQQGTPVNGFLTASPVYPLVQNASGQRTGFLPDGTVVQEIPDSYAVGVGEKRLILLPEMSRAALSIAGYAPGTMDLVVTLAQPGGGDLTLTYAAVPTTAGAQMSFDSADSQRALRVTSNGQTETREPSEAVLTTATGASQVIFGGPVTSPTGIPCGTAPAVGLILMAPPALYLVSRRGRARK
ncbi:MAG: hypothetical protein KKB13_06910 [Chloroflexi bacterium]|nr:hypothetical protein [Chloroflexota bacterium]